MRAGDVFEVTVERAVAGGRMLARHDSHVVLVAGAIPGERVRARIARVNRHVIFADTIEVIEASADRRPPAADPACGGADYAHVRYERQADLKRDILVDAFRRIGKRALDPNVTVAQGPERGYRLRARLHVQGRRAGFFREHTHQICDAGPTGQLRAESLAAVDAALTVLAPRLAACNALVIVENIAGTERVIHIEPRAGGRFDDVRGKIELPAGVTGLSCDTGRRPVALMGAPTVTDSAGQIFGAGSPIGALAAWTRHATSFFQGNRFLTGPLLERVLTHAEGDRFVDLYSGVGLFAIALAARGAKGLAVEGDRSSGADLAANAGPWPGVRVMRSRVEDAAKLALDPPPDVVIVDPPRAGMSPEALRGVLDWRPRRLVYVSCDPPTLARDAGRLIEAGYGLEAVEGFDLFPNTAHVEAVAVFTIAG